MSRRDTLKPMPNLAFGAMKSTMKLTDLLFPSGRAERRLADVPLRKAMTVVDYGCGPGRYTIPMAEIVGVGGRVYAVDIQPLAIETVKRKAAGKGLINVQPVLVNSYHTGLLDASVDLVLLVDVVHGIQDRASLFQEIHRLLKSGGLLYMDSGHSSTSEMKSQVEATGLFTMVKFDGRNMLLSRK